MSRRPCIFRQQDVTRALNVVNLATAGAVRRAAFHPLANIFPLIEDAEFDELVVSIRDNGLRDPVTIYDGMIIDGRNRQRAMRRREHVDDGALPRVAARLRQ
jgi:hypothetical protein